MNYEEKLQVLWAGSFVVSGIIFAVAIYITPMIGLFALGYIVLYVGLAMAFMMMFRSMGTLPRDTLKTMKDRKKEIEEVEKEIEGKFFSKRIDKDTYSSMMQDYERQLAELEVRIKGMNRKK